MKGALVANPNFRYERIAEDENLKEILSSFSVLYVHYRAEIDGVETEVVSLSPIDEESYVGRIEKLVDALISHGVEGIVTVGGDGTASYVASSLIKTGRGDIAIIGYPAGTANCGPIVRYGLKRDAFERTKRMDAIEVSSGGRVLGYGFNDVVVANTFLGTIDNRLVSLSAEVMERDGRSEEETPSGDILSSSFAFSINGKKIQSDYSSVSGIYISTLCKDRLMGRAVSGGLLSACGLEHPAAVTFTDRVLVTADQSSWNHKGLTESKQIVFDENDRLFFSGFSSLAHVIIDGNPFAIEDGKIEIRIKPEAVTVGGC